LLTWLMRRASKTIAQIFSVKKKKANYDPFGGVVPPIVTASVTFLEKYGLQVEGIFRLSGEFKKVEAIIKSFEKGKPVLWDSNTDPHEVAGVLKSWLCELESPLLTTELHDSFIAAQAAVSREAVLRRLATVIELLPPSNKQIFKMLIKLFVDVAQFKDVNKMGATNLAIVFAPTLLRYTVADLTKMLAHSEAANRVILLCIENFTELFENTNNWVNKTQLEHRLSMASNSKKTGLMMVRKLIAEQDLANEGAAKQTKSAPSTLGQISDSKSSVDAKLQTEESNALRAINEEEKKIKEEREKQERERQERERQEQEKQIQEKARKIEETLTQLESFKESSNLTGDDSKKLLSSLLFDENELDFKFDVEVPDLDSLSTARYRRPSCLFEQLAERTDDELGDSLNLEQEERRLQLLELEEQRLLSALLGSDADDLMSELKRSSRVTDSMNLLQEQEEILSGLNLSGSDFGLDLRKEQLEKEDSERLLQEQRRLEQDQLRAIELERIRQVEEFDHQEQDRLRQEQEQQLERARQEQERLRQEQERIRQEQEQERIRLEQERIRKLEFEQEQERIRLEQERVRLEQEQERIRLEQERIAREQQEKERVRLEQERLERERLERELIERARLEKEQQQRFIREQEELERIRIEEERVRLEKEQQDRLRLEQEQERIRLEQERILREQERVRLEQQQEQERIRLEKEKLALQQRLLAEQQEQERIRREQEELQRQRLEQENLAKRQQEDLERKARQDKLREEQRLLEQKRLEQQALAQANREQRARQQQQQQQSSPDSTSQQEALLQKRQELEQRRLALQKAKEFRQEQERQQQQTLLESNDQSKIQEIIQQKKAELLARKRQIEEEQRQIREQAERDLELQKQRDLERQQAERELELENQRKKQAERDLELQKQRDLERQQIELASKSHPPENSNSTSRPVQQKTPPAGSSSTINRPPGPANRPGVNKPGNGERNQSVANPNANLNSNSSQVSQGGSSQSQRNQTNANIPPAGRTQLSELDALKELSNVTGRSSAASRRVRNTASAPSEISSAPQSDSQSSNQISSQNPQNSQPENSGALNELLELAGEPRRLSARERRALKSGGIQPGNLSTPQETSSQPEQANSNSTKQTNEPEPKISSVELIQQKEPPTRVEVPVRSGVPPASTNPSRGNPSNVTRGAPQTGGGVPRVTNNANIPPSSTGGEHANRARGAGASYRRPRGTSPTTPHLRGAPVGPRGNSGAPRGTGNAPISRPAAANSRSSVPDRSSVPPSRIQTAEETKAEVPIDFKCKIDVISDADGFDDEEFSKLLHSAQLSQQQAAQAPLDEEEELIMETTIVYTDGGRYVGGVRDSMWHGHGRCYFADGNFYEGEVDNNAMNGLGTLIFANGDKYVGQWKSDQHEGWGRYTSVNGDVYEGEWLNNLRHGKGTYKMSSGDEYEGEFAFGVPHGKGVYKFENGDVYTGEFVNDEFHGKGVYVSVTGKRYEGDFVNGERNGNATIVLPSGDRYEGQVVNGTFHGDGVYYFKDGGEIKGKFQNGKPVQ